MRAVMSALPMAGRRRTAGDAGCELVTSCAMGTHSGERGLSTRCAALDWNGEIPLRTAGNDEQASSVATPAVEGRQRPRKPGPALLYAASPVERGVRRFPLRLPVKWIRSSDDRSTQSAILLRAAVRPLVRMPTDRHTATGTCEIGQLRT